MTFKEYAEKYKEASRFCALVNTGNSTDITDNETRGIYVDTENFISDSRKLSDIHPKLLNSIPEKVHLLTADEFSALFFGGECYDGLEKNEKILIVLFSKKILDENKEFEAEPFKPFH